MAHIALSYVGRKTAWYVFKQAVKLLWKGEEFFRFNWADNTDVATAITAMEHAQTIIKHGKGGVIYIEPDGRVGYLIDGKEQTHG